MNEKKEENKILGNKIDETLYSKSKKRGEMKKALSFKPNNIRMGIIYSEILGKPKSRRG